MICKAWFCFVFLSYTLLRSFLVLRFQFRVITSHCVQVFSQDKSIYEAVENAFITIYVRKNPVETARNLLNLATDSNIGDLAALEFILGALVSKGDITASMVSSLLTRQHMRGRVPVIVVCHICI